MKTLVPDELIELLPASDDLVNEALKRFEFAAPVLCREPGYCKQLVSEGWTQPVQINFRGKPAFVVSWHVTSDRGFWLDIAQTLNAGAPVNVLFAGVELIARRQNARYIRFQTMRRGLVKLSKDRGYKPEAVLMVKPL